ncbi:hypothetical protein CDD81_4821 [Ophiocordyceps australis]|uniref:Response regulatory domain-containing protein n=1 Tax=Ophiocordyceps australis TaxID=1399860 RepID=A0A2C5Y680_9HYPO|nr:hypothetical protein CDD81_4821 [Ophiocordyceps australis]
MASDIASRLKARLGLRRRSASVNGVVAAGGDEEAAARRQHKQLATSSSTSFLRPRLTSRQQSRMSRASGRDAEGEAASTSASSVASPASLLAAAWGLVRGHEGEARIEGARDRDRGRGGGDGRDAGQVHQQVQLLLPPGAAGAPTAVRQPGELQTPLEGQAGGQAPTSQLPPPSPSSCPSPTSPPSPVPSSRLSPRQPCSCPAAPAAAPQTLGPSSLSPSGPAAATAPVAATDTAAAATNHLIAAPLQSPWHPLTQDSPPPPPVSHQSHASSQLRSIREYSFPPPAASSSKPSSATPSTASPVNAAHQDAPLIDDAASDSRHGTGPEHDLLSVLSSALVTPAASSTSGAAAIVPHPAPDADALRQQSIFTSRQTSLIKSLLNSIAAASSSDAAAISAAAATAAVDADTAWRDCPSDANMVARKIWVKRPHCSATTISINDDDLVDDVRDMILRKYSNSLGRTFDSPDLNIRINSRDYDKDRLLGPEEVMSRTLDHYYPGGQSVDDALVIDIPRRTPKPSPRAPLPPGTASYYLADDGRPSEAGEGYFPPVVTMPSPHPHAMHSAVSGAPPNGPFPHSIAVLGTGHIPPVPSPGGSTTGRPRAVRERSERPRIGRQHTSSPTILPGHPATSTAATANLSHASQHAASRVSRSRAQSTSSDQQPLPPPAKMPMAKSPGPGAEPTPAVQADAPAPRLSSPRPSNSRPKKPKKSSDYPQTVTGGNGVNRNTNGNNNNNNSNNSNNVLNGIVPPISVLIVEDNPINLKLLEAFVKRLKVRWQTAMNGRDAVKKWRTGGFHLVLMDIQLPVMNGLDATREIRRLERVNSIGVFSSTPSSGLPPEENGDLKAQDRLENHALFKSPVIIVALTASSLQSDRHDALAAGCNDFLTKPVNFVWLERKVMEWGCMQALIDFDGWRKWKDFSQVTDATDGGKKVAMGAKARTKQQRSSASSST